MEVSSCYIMASCDICRARVGALQAGALTKLKRLSSSRLRNASGASPRAQAGSEAARPDHFAAALERLRRDQQAEKHTSKQQGQQQSAGQHTLRCAAGETLLPSLSVVTAFARAY